MELLYREYYKCQEVELNKSNLPYAKLMHHNPDKWKMKFKGIFEREKIISFDSGRTSTVDLKRFKQTTFSEETFEQITVLKPLGEEILCQPKFWLLLISLSSVK